MVCGSANKKGYIVVWGRVQGMQGKGDKGVREKRASHRRGIAFAMGNGGLSICTRLGGLVINLVVALIFLVVSGL